MSTYIGNNEISGIYVGNSEISSIYVGTDLVYSSGGGDTTNYLRFTSQQDGSTVALSKNGTNMHTITLEYSLDKVNWNTWDRSAVTLNSGDKMYLRGNNPNGFSYSGTNYYGFNISGDVKVSGSIMTLLDKADELRIIPSQACFDKLFYGCSGLTDASELELPATVLKTLCYESLLRECRNLTKAPRILPANTLWQSCYQSMFINDTSLVSAPILPATTLATYCYNNLFNGCSSLNTVTSYASNISAANSLNNWLSGVSATGTFYNYGGATYPSGASGIPTGWTEVTQ